jgi:uncharacterized membrane protein YhaH (DUF805 family)
MAWYRKVLMSFAEFGGRARRREYWAFLLIHLLVYVFLMMIDAFIGLGSNAGYGLLSGLYWLATLLPWLAVAVRRLHDTGRSGLWLLVLFVPILGALILVVFLLLNGESGTNRYGPNPKLENV